MIRPFPRVADYLRRHEFVKHVLTVMSGTAVGQLLLIVTIPIVTRLVSPSDWGVYTVVFSIGSFLLPVAALRYDMAIVLPPDEEDARHLHRLASALNLLISGVFTAVLWIFGRPIAGWIGHREAGPWMLAAGLITWSYCQVSIATYFSTRRKRFKTVSQSTIANSVVTASGRLGSAFAGLGPLGLLGATTLGEFAALGVFGKADGRTRPWKDHAPFDFARMRELGREYRRMPLLMTPNALIDSVRVNGINVELAHFISSGALGNFNMAWGLVQTPAALISAALAQVFFQRLSVTKPGSMYQLVSRTIVRALAVAILPFAAIFFLAPPVLPWLLGPGWRQVGEVAALLTPWLSLNFVTSPMSTIFVVVRKQWIALLFSVVYMAVPLVIIWQNHASMLHTVRLVSMSMAILLVIYLALVIWVSRLYDGQASPKPAETIA